VQSVPSVRTLEACLWRSLSADGGQARLDANRLYQMVSCGTDGVLAAASTIQVLLGAN